MLVTMLVLAGCKSSEDQKLNILWIYVEDISPDLGCYGNELAHTPFLDQMAEQGILYSNAITPAPVCSPIRSALITGVMQTTLGLHNHHSSRTESSAIYLPDSIQTIPEILKHAGYFTFNHGKDDYNFWYQREDLYSGSYRRHGLYGNSGLEVDWNDRSDPSQPFFGQIQLRGGKHIFAENFQDKLTAPKVDRSKVKLPPYYPQDSIFVEEWARYLDSHQITDSEVASIIERLRNDGVLEQTIIFFFADHGMRGLRHKQFVYDGGLKVPFMIADYGNHLKSKGTIKNEQVNLLDISATTLSLAGVSLPDYLDGKNLLDPNYQGHEYIVSARDRCDFTIDRIRSVRSPRFKYIRNFMTDRSALQPNYRDEWASTIYFRELYQKGALSPTQAAHIKDDRPVEELYELVNDPHEVVNLADSLPFQENLLTHRNVLENWISSTNDQGQYPEGEEGLKFMLGIWGEQAVNPEYDIIRQHHPELAGSLEQRRFDPAEIIEVD